MATLDDVCSVSTRIGHTLPLAFVAARVDGMLVDGGTLHHVHGIVDNAAGIIRRRKGARFLDAVLRKLAADRK